jgi:hypothetical protein
LRSHQKNVNERMPTFFHGFHQEATGRICASEGREPAEHMRAPRRDVRARCALW